MNSYNDYLQGGAISPTQQKIIGGVVGLFVVIAIAVLIFKSSKKVVECGKGDILCNLTS